MLGALPDQCVADARRRRAAALIWRGERISYGELGEMVESAHAQLAQLKLPEQRPAAILAKKSPQAIALILACLRTRRPVLLPSVALGPETLGELCAQAGCSHVLSPRDDPAGIAAEVVGSGGARSTPWWSDDAGVAMMLTTSGSTGTPKIVPLTHGAFDRFTAWAAARFDIQAGTTVLNYAPLNFDLSLLDIWTTLEHGGCVALVDQDRATNAGYLLDLLKANEVHVVQAVPMLFRLLLDAARDGADRLHSVAHVLVTGDSIPAATLTALFDLFPRSRFHNVYGCTETNDSFIHEIDPSGVSVESRIPIGEPLPGVGAVIVAREGRVVQGPGTGELLVTTPFQTPGYLPEPLNDGKFVPHPEGLDSRPYFRTGDVVRRDADGTITLEGRTDCHVKVRGVRVNTEAVERVILEHEQVLEVAVVPMPDELGGHRLHAVAQRRPASGLNSLSLRQHCARRLDRAAIPTTLEVVTAPLPKTPTGKVDRQRTVHHHQRRRAGD